MAQPAGFVHPQLPNSMFLLNKALYGLKQAHRAWFSRLSTRLLELGFLASKADTSLFVFVSANVHLLALVYVDDIILTRSLATAFDDLICFLSLDFPIKDLGYLRFFLGIKVQRSSFGLHLSQQRYILTFLLGQTCS